MSHTNYDETIAYKTRPNYQKLFEPMFVLADVRPEVKAYKQFENFYGIQNLIPFVARRPSEIHWFDSWESANDYLAAYKSYAQYSKVEIPEMHIVQVKSIYVNVPKWMEGK